MVLKAIRPLSTLAGKRKGNISGGPSMAMTVTGVCLVCVRACVRVCMRVCMRARVWSSVSLFFAFLHFCFTFMIYLAVSASLLHM